MAKKETNIVAARKQPIQESFEHRTNKANNKSIIYLTPFSFNLLDSVGD